MRSHDQGFVAASPDRVYRTLDDLSTYPSWWRGSEMNGESIAPPLSKRSRPASPESRRESIGLFLVFGDDSLEWYLEPFDEGTIVSAILDVDVPGSSGRASRRLLRMRGAVRDGLVGLKRQLEGAS